MIWSLFWSVSVVVFFLLSISAADKAAQLREMLLKEHNMYRKQHHVPPLRESQNLAVTAKLQAQRYFSVLNDFELPDRNIRFGDNIWFGTQITIDMLLNGKTNPVNEWYSKINFYPHEPFTKWYQFTQLIWKSTKDVGCGYFDEPETYRLIVVCKYQPSGNIYSKFRENVFKVDGTPWDNKVEKDKTVKDVSGGGSFTKVDAGSSSTGGSVTKVDAGSSSTGGSVTKVDAGSSSTVGSVTKVDAGSSSTGGSVTKGDVGSSTDGSLTPSVSEDGKASSGSKDPQELSSPFWIYGLGFVILFVVVL